MAELFLLRFTLSRRTTEFLKSVDACMRSCSKAQGCKGVVIISCWLRVRRCKPGYSGPFLFYCWV